MGAVCVALALAVAVESVSGVITVQIGGATRLNSLSRQRERERYSCYWDCDLVGCQIARDDDECAYDCEKICRVRYDYASAAGRTGASASAEPTAKADATLSGKSAAAVGSGENIVSENDINSELIGGEFITTRR